MSKQQPQSKAHRAARAGIQAAGIAAGTTVLFAPGAEAATRTVTNLNDSGAGSLRDAVESGGAGDVIGFQSGLTGQITLTSGDILIDHAVTIIGPGADLLTISGNDASRIFYVNTTVDAASVSIEKLTLADGMDDGGGAIQIQNGALTLTSAKLTGNVASGDGGAIYQRNNGDALVIRDSVISENTASSNGAGICLYGSTTLIEDTTISGNVLTAGRDGGGVKAFLNNDVQALTINRSTITGNEAPEGAGLSLYAESPNKATITNSTVTGNTASEEGGGIKLYGQGGTFSVESTTISGNEAGTIGGGIYQKSSSTSTLESTIVADNSDSTPTPDLARTGGSTINARFSLLESPSPDAINGDNEANIVGKDPELGPLASNGGKTQTRRPAKTSPAIDQGSASPPTTDQRGLERPVDVPTIANATGGDGSDIGAVEFQFGLNKTPPTISGRAEPGGTLTADPGTWSGSPTSFTYQFLRCEGDTCSPVGDGSATYAVTAADVGKTIRVDVAAVTQDETSAPVRSAPVAVKQPAADPAPAPAPVAPPAPPAVVTPASACDVLRLSLVSVKRSDGRVRIVGLARPSLAGRSVTLLTNGKATGTARVAADGTFSGTVPLPAAKRRARAKFGAALGSTERTVSRRLTRGMSIASPKGGTARGRLSGPGRARRIVSIQVSVGCGAFVRAGRVKSDGKGRFAVPVSRPFGARGPVIYKATATLNGVKRRVVVLIR